MNTANMTSGELTACIEQAVIISHNETKMDDLNIIAQMLNEWPSPDGRNALRKAMEALRNDHT